MNSIFVIFPSFCKYRNKDRSVKRMGAEVERVLYGRELLKEEIPKEYYKLIENNNVQKLSGFVLEKGKWFCRRCHTPITFTNESYCLCNEKCGYCTNCLQMGKVKKCSTFYHLPELNDFEDLKEPILTWNGTLSAQQAKASEEIVQSVNQQETRLLWAVAGAGKTEMLFFGIEQALKQKKRVCLASPRVDVCLELAPRLRSSFNVPLAVLYGEMEEEYQYTPLVIATTHQLYRFKEAFDVMIIDEMDAFPFHLDTALHFAANKARKKCSTLLYLTATPDRLTRKQVKQSKLKASILPARYHGRPLPVPKTKWSRNWKENMLKYPLRTSPIRHMKELIQKQQVFLVFVPNIRWMKQLESVLQRILPKASFVSVHSNDPDRKEKVQLMRERKLDFLIATTILERGVTFPNIDVLVIGTEEQIYTEAALVQISGRAGRAFEYPTGNVTFYHDGFSKEMKRAIRQIKQMNQLARKRGLLK